MQLQQRLPSKITEKSQKRRRVFLARGQSWNNNQKGEDLKEITGSNTS